MLALLNELVLTLISLVEKSAADKEHTGGQGVLQCLNNEDGDHNPPVQQLRRHHLYEESVSHRLQE